MTLEDSQRKCAGAVAVVVLCSFNYLRYFQILYFFLLSFSLQYTYWLCTAFVYHNYAAILTRTQEKTFHLKGHCRQIKVKSVESVTNSLCLCVSL